jgi:acetyl esterase/lipase
MFSYPLSDSTEVLMRFQIREHKAKEFNLDLERVAVGGCSAGGHLAAVIAHLCRDEGIPLAFQLLSVPVCDLHVFDRNGKLLPDQPYESYRECEFTQPLPAARMSYFHNQFLGVPRPKDLDGDWKVSPIKASNFTGLAPALVITAELDPLRDEGVAYARKMNEAGSRAELHQIKGAPHIVMQLDDILEGGKEYNRVVIKTLREALVKKD